MILSCLSLFRKYDAGAWALYLTRFIPGTVAAGSAQWVLVSRARIAPKLVCGLLGGTRIPRAAPLATFSHGRNNGGDDHFEPQDIIVLA